MAPAIRSRFAPLPMHACIDLGSNSFHLLIGEWQQGRIEIVERLSEKVQLGENVRRTAAKFLRPHSSEDWTACVALSC
jgi:exopolyphosphatase/pppGpp-phosphohydrolase